MDREGEVRARPCVIYAIELILSPVQDARCAENDGLANRKLLWHGTNVAVVAAILKSGACGVVHSSSKPLICLRRSSHHAALARSCWTRHLLCL